METSGLRVLITGGATGIGLALAEAFSCRGNEVLVCGRRKGKLQKASSRVKGLKTKVADIRSKSDRRALVSWARKGAGLDVLVNNAGIQCAVDFTKGPLCLPKADDEIETNLVAAIHVTALLLPHLMSRPRAAIVNVSSGLAFTPLATVPVYCATKAALHSLSLTLRHQLVGTPVRVLEVIPPIVASELGASHRPAHVNERALPPEVVAEASLRALSLDHDEVAVGDAQGLREKREALFAVLNPRR